MTSTIEGAYDNDIDSEEGNDRKNDTQNRTKPNRIDTKDIENTEEGNSSSNPKATTKCYSINTYMIPAKIAYFMNGARFEISTYFMLFYISAGLSPFEAGMVNGLQYLGGMIGNPLWGLLADKKGYRRFIVIFLCFMGVVTAGIQPYFAYIYGDRSRNVCPVTNASIGVNITISAKDNSQASDNSSLYYSFLICAILFASFEGSIASFVDAGILGRCQASPRPAQIGSQRLFSSIGSSLGSLGYSASIQYFPPSQMTCFVGIFITYTVFAIGTAVSGFPLYIGASSKTSSNQRQNVLKDLIKYLKDFDNFFFLLNVLFTGIFQGVLFTFLFVFLKELNAPTMLFGLSICFNSISSVTVYSLSGRFIRLLGGPKNALCIACFMWAIRCFITSLLVNPYYVLILDVFHGFSYSLSKVSALENVNQTAPKNIFTTLCGINNLLFISCGFLIASMGGGKLYQLFGAKSLYLGTSYVGFAWGCINIVYLLVRKFKTRGVTPTS